MKFYILRYVASVPHDFGGYTFIISIKIKLRYLGDKGLFWHEYTHVEQNYKHPFKGLIAYISKYWFHIRWKWAENFLIMKEVEAYRVQLSYSPGNADIFADYIATKYGFDITYGEAYRLLTKEE